jgi:hypothetical protein
MKSHFCMAGGSVALLTATTLALAQAQSTATLPPNVPPPGGIVSAHPVGVEEVPPPPSNFNPLTASPLALRQYVVPPPPDPQLAPDAYRRWLQAVVGAHRHSSATLTQTNIANHPAKILGSSVLQPNVKNIAVTSSNWSGTAIFDPARPFQREAIQGEFVVPVARQAYGACTGDWVYSTQWVGMDGYNSNDVLQAGVEADAYCNGSTTVAFYSAWIEWFPFNETRVSVPAFRPGDLAYIQVWNTSPVPMPIS